MIDKMVKSYNWENILKFKELYFKRFENDLSHDDKEVINTFVRILLNRLNLNLDPLI